MIHVPLRLPVPALLLLGLVSCSSPSRQQEATATADSALRAAETTPVSETSCYRQTLNGDTTTLQLVLTGDRATGDIHIQPAEKDRADGSFSGTRTGNQIRADWQRSGEGMTQRYDLDLTLSGDSISWGEGERVEQNGRWVLKQPGGTYRYRLAKTDCP
ncbi:hypothetical protein GCM10027578_25370 [Spirosoma luteolum]